MEIASDIGAKPQPHKLSYDKIVKNTLAQSKELTIRFVNGLFGDKIPSGASVVWLDKETVNDKHVGFVADFYPRIDGNMYHIEIEQDDRGGMAVRVFKYTLGGALLHNMAATDTELSVTFPKPHRLADAGQYPGDHRQSRRNIKNGGWIHHGYEFCGNPAVDRLQRGVAKK